MSKALYCAASILLLVQCILGQAKPAPETPNHPVQLPVNTDSATCLECHSSIKDGKYVHTALEMGCTVCHSIKEVGKDGTSITLVSPPDQLCFTCHTKSTDPVQHMPYAEGGCIVCHSPHSSNFPAHTLASHQDVCLGCHAKGLPKIDVSKHMITTPWGAVFSSGKFRGVAFLGLNQAHTAGHPTGGHPVSGPNTAKVPSAQNVPAEMSCFACHEAHTSTQIHLRLRQYESQMQLCTSCHTNIGY